MKIAFVCDRVNPMYNGGYEYLIYNLSQRLSKHHEITVFTSMNEDFIFINKVKYVRIVKKYHYVSSKGIHNFRDSLRFALSLYRNLHKLENFDIVILNTIPYFLFGYLMKRIRAKKISIFHEAWYDYLKEMNLILRYLLPREIENIVKHSNLIVAVSSKTHISLTKNYKANKIVTIPIGIETDSFSEEIEYKYDIIYLGRLANIKHLDILINSVGLLKQEMPEIKVAIGGDGDELENLISLAEKLGLSNNIKFLGKFENSDKYNLLRSAKIFVLPSEREGYSIATLEAMYCGTVPIVAMPKYDEVFGCSDFVINNVTGLYYNFGDTEELIQKIIYLLRDQKIYHNLRDNGVNNAKKYNWNNIIDEYNKVINSL